MPSDFTRRAFLGSTVALGAGLAAGQEPPAGSEGGKLKILAIGGSPRKPSTTAAALEVCLEAARAVDPRITTELIELAGLELQGDLAAGIELPAGQRDDFPALLPVLTDPAVAGVLIGTPTYFGGMLARCKAFLDRSIALRKNFAWSGKVAGVVAVGGALNGGQELAIQSVQHVLMCHEMLLVGDGRPTAHRGATVWNDKSFAAITDDTFGMDTCRNLGRRMAEAILAQHRP